MDVWLEWTFPGSDAVPEFWQFQEVGCNAAGIRLRERQPTQGCDASDQLCGDGACLSVITAFSFGSSAGLPVNRGRLAATVYRGAAPTSLSGASTRHFAFELEVATGQSSACAGCSEEGDLRWTLGELYASPGPNGEPEGIAAVLSDKAPESTAVIAWVAEPDVNCNVTPVHRTSWGALKSFYR